MSSLVLSGTLIALAVSSLLNIWFFVNRNAHAASLPESPSVSLFTLPKGWWSNADRFQTERRAIFSQVSTHIPRPLRLTHLLPAVELDVCEPPWSFQDAR